MCLCIQKTKSFFWNLQNCKILTMAKDIKKGKFIAKSLLRLTLQSGGYLNLAYKHFNNFYLLMSQHQVAMSLSETILNEIITVLWDKFLQSQAFIIDNLLQTLFFTLAVIQLISWVLHSLNLFFARSFTKSNIAIALTFLFFLYLKIWNTYSAHMEILGYLCAVSLSIHLYEGCVRRGTDFCRRLSKNSFGNISSIISIVLIFLSFKVFKLSQLDEKSGKYPYVALYFLIFGLILIIGVLRKKQFIYFLILASMTALIITTRYWLLLLLKDTFLQKTSLPLQCAIYILVAVQENYDAINDEIQLKRLKGKLNRQQQKVEVSKLMFAQAFYFIFFLVKKRAFHIQIVFASICLLSYLGVKKNN